jgi:hypothetical protein
MNRAGSFIAVVAFGMALAAPARAGDSDGEKDEWSQQMRRGVHQEGRKTEKEQAEEQQEAEDSGTDKKIGLGGDLALMFPLGDLADGTGPMIGPLLRGGYRVIPPLELTARIGYLVGLSKDQSQTLPGGTVSASSHLTDIPIWLGARYFFMKDNPMAGVYGAAEIGMNFMTSSGSEQFGGRSIDFSDAVNRFGFDLGVGYVISRELPIDFRLQYTMLNLIGRESGETTAHTLGLSVGYTLQL